MGFFKKLVSKIPCEICGNEVGALNRTKTKDGKYICYDCCKNCSAFYPVVNHSFEEVQKHMEYMKNSDAFCREVFDKESNKLDFALMFQKSGIVFADNLGMFEIVSNETKKKNYRELFRYDQVLDYKLYGVEDKSEKASKKYKESGVMIKMLNMKSVGSDNVLADVLYDYAPFKHGYAEEFTVLCQHATDELDGGLVLKHLDEIYNVIAEGSLKKTVQWTKGRDRYRKLSEVDKYFNRGHWKEVADNAERAFFGKTLREM